MPTLPPCFSIFIRVINDSHRLTTCLEILVRQIFRGVEALLLNGSTELLRAYPKWNARALAKPGTGIFAAMNAGLDRARGEGLQFLGCDARWFVRRVYRPARDLADTPMVGSPYLLRHVIHHQGLFCHRSLSPERRYRTSLGVVADYELNPRLNRWNLRAQRHLRRATELDQSIRLTWF